MAAICGALRFDGGEASAGEILRILGRMAHRTPDGRNAWASGAAALGHGALHATPESCLERQPLRLQRWSLVVDGRVDDRPALARALGLDAASLSTTSDAELFGLAWLRWREEFWQHVTGDFALAAWDRESGELFLARDRVGVRPLMYATTPRGLVFASEAEALLGWPGVSAEPDEDRLAQALVDGFDDDDPAASWYRDIRRLRPGECMRVGADGTVHLRRYWTLAPLPLLRLRDAGEYVEAFREVFDVAVRCRLRSTTPPALMLSGGIDSAAVLASARALRESGHPQVLRPVAVVADAEFGRDESRNIEAMLSQVDSEACIRLVPPDFGALQGFDDFAARTMDHAHPTDNSVLLPMLVANAASQAGSRVLLDGIDGDLALLTPDDYAARLLVAGRPREAWQEACAASRVNTYLTGSPPLRILARGLASRMEPTAVALLRYRLRHWRNGEDWLGDLVDRDWARRLRIRQRRLSMSMADRRLRTLRTHAGYLCHVWWAPGFTRGMECFDHAVAKSGLEAWHPWADLRVLEFLLRVPLEFKVREGWTKYLARAAYSDPLGGVAWHSGKEHLGPLVTAAILASSARLVQQGLDEAGHWLEGVVDAGAITRLQSLWSGRRDVPWDGMDEVLRVATLSRWRRWTSAAVSTAPGQG